MVDYAEATALRDKLKPVYQERHDDLRKLRDYWHGRWWQNDASDHPLSSVFRDLRRPDQDFGPDVKMVHNVLHMVCLKYQTFLSGLPQIRAYVDPPGTDTRRKQARTKERYLYGVWNESDMAKVVNRIAWYLPLMGHAWLGIWPDFDRNLPRAVLRSPEYSFPVPGWEGTDSDAVIFEWKVDAEWAKQIPGYTPVYQSRRILPGRRSTSGTNKVTIIEYSGASQWTRWVDGQEVNNVEHNLGFNLFQSVKFIDVPDEPFGHGAVEQIVSQNELTNALISMLFQSVIDNVFPQLVLEDPSKAPETIAKGPGSVLPLNPGGKAYYLTPPVQAVAMQQQFLDHAIHNIKEGSHMPEVNFGVSPATNIVTGKAIDELQGAGTGSTIEMVQGNGIGPALVKFNEMAIVMGQRMFADDQINLFGYETPTPTEIKGKPFALTIKGSQLVGSPRNDVIFNPTMDAHSKLVMNLQAMNAGIVSKEHTRNQLGIPDSEAMDEEIMAERIQDGVLAAILAMMQQEETPQAAQQATDQAVMYLDGAPLPKPTAQAGPHPLLNVGAPAAASAGGSAPPPGLSANEQPSGPPLPGLPGGSGLPSPQPPAGAAGPASPQQLTVDLVASLIKSVDGLSGRVWLVGEIVQNGSTANEVEVAVTDPADRQRIVDAVPQLHGRLVFHVVKGAPSEASVEVTRG